MTTDMLEQLLRGAVQTLRIFATGSVVATAVALLVGSLGVAPFRPARVLSTCIIEFFRGTSLIVQLFWIFYVLPTWGVFLTPFQAVVIAIGLNSGAFGAHLVRGAIRQVPRGQIEAAVSLNMGWWLRLRRVVLPQAVVGLLPPYGNLMIEMLKGTSLASLVTINEVTFNGQLLRAGHSAATLQIFVAILVIYFVISQVVSGGFRFLESLVSRGLDVGRRSVR